MKILIIFGTRPEAIKMAPLYLKLKSNESVDVKLCVTAQHRQMLDSVLSFFDITPDYDLNLMKPGQNLYQLTSEVIVQLKPVLEDFNPKLVLVHGDTTTSSAAALSAFYYGARVGHIEAGLRTYNKYSPFPEEVNRQITSRIADFHFAPTQVSCENLISEGISDENISITGNTVIDALQLAVKKLESYDDQEIMHLKTLVDHNKKIILVTGHRRENFGEGFLQICKALKSISGREDVQIIYPVHLNPNVQHPVNSILSGCENVKLISPLSYAAFVWLMTKSHIILTDSGGIQEEAPSLGKPVLVMRDTTERPEAVNAGVAKLVGTSSVNIINECADLLDNPEKYSKMSNAVNPYGDGKAAEKIIAFITGLHI